MDVSVWVIDDNNGDPANALPFAALKAPTAPVADTKVHTVGYSGGSHHSFESFITATKAAMPQEGGVRFQQVVDQVSIIQANLHHQAITEASNAVWFHARLLPQGSPPRLEER